MCMHVPIPPFTHAHMYIITVCIFFVRFGFGLKWLLFVKVVLILKNNVLFLLFCSFILVWGYFF